MSDRGITWHQLLIFTSEAEFSAEGAPGQAISPTSVRIKRHSDHGSSFLDPLLIGNAAIFNTAKGNYVGNFLFNFQTGAFGGSDLTMYGRHLFENHTIVDWDLAEVPWPVIWAARDDGVLLSCTYDPATGTLAWARHETTGKVKRVRVIPEGTEDAVYLVVDRFWGAFMERMESRFVSDVKSAVFLDAAVVYDGRNTGITSVQVSPEAFTLNFGPGDPVTVTSGPTGIFTAANVGDAIVIEPDGIAVRIRLTEFVSTFAMRGILDEALPETYQNLATMLWGLAKGTMTGLDHLNLLNVTMLADGAVQGPFVAAAGAAGPLDPPAVRIVAGLSYNSDAELLDVAAPSEKTSVKAIVRMIWEVVASRGLWTGEDFDHLKEWIQREVEDSFENPPLVTQQVEVPLEAHWNTGGRAVIRQVDPLPLTVVAGIREIVVGGR